MDDNRPGPNNMEDCILYGWEDWVIVRSAENVKKLLQMGLVNDLSLDHDMGINSKTSEENTNGRQLVLWMINENKWPKGVITIHSQNLKRAQDMKDDIDRFRPVEKETDIITIRQEDWT